jgi:Mlc titration factor MtfA (ptsG expression regulator)
MPPEWTRILEEQVWQFRSLNPKQRSRLEAWVRVFVAERHWEGCDGLQVSDAMRVVIAGQAGLLVLGYDDWYFDQTPSILIYPDDYTARDVPRSVGGGFTLVGDEDRAGEAWYRGPIVLAWPDVVAGGMGTNHGHNLVVHEFAHHLDMIRDPHADGKPPMPDEQADQLWDRVVPREFQRLRAQCAAGQRTLIRCYGATNAAEFFAVTSELYFQLPTMLRTHMPELYDAFKRFYRVDPEQWSG